MAGRRALGPGHRPPVTSTWVAATLYVVGGLFQVYGVMLVVKNFSRLFFESSEHFDRAEQLDGVIGFEWGSGTSAQTDQNVQAVARTLKGLFERLGVKARDQEQSDRGGVRWVVAGIVLTTIASLVSLA